MTSRVRTLSIRLGIGAVAAGAVLGFTGGASTPVAHYSPEGSASNGIEPNGIEPNGTEPNGAVDALIALPADSALVYMPTDFTRTLGYFPTIEDGLLVDPSGGCSSPIPLPADFDSACKQHDLGYDLLRFESEYGASTAAQARVQLDTRLGGAMHSTCTDRPSSLSRVTCHAMADVATIAVQFNSWRQHYDAPEPEPALPFLVGMVGVTVLAAATSTATLARRRSTTEYVS